MRICLTDSIFREFSAENGLKSVCAWAVCARSVVGVAAVRSDSAYEADDDAKAAYVVTRKEERLVDRAVF